MPHVKAAVKEALDRVGVLGPAEYVYFNLKSASLATLAYELRARRGMGPDGHPMPPPRLIFDVIACRWGKVFYDSGRKVLDDMERALRRQGMSLRWFEQVLDFGCGCGRLIRHVQRRTEAELHGCDYNRDLVAWCREYLAFADFSVNGLEPPMPYDDASFDFLYARSIFTHLPEDLLAAWMRDMRRVLQPGGILYLTMHGQQYAGVLDPAQRARFRAGELVVRFAESAGANRCATYASPAYVQQNLLEGFELLEFVEGRKEDNLRQDIYLLHKEVEVG